MTHLVGIKIEAFYLWLHNNMNISFHTWRTTYVLHLLYLDEEGCGLSVFSVSCHFIFNAALRMRECWVALFSFVRN